MSEIDVLIRPRITEKNTMLGVAGKYTFDIDPRADKRAVKAAVERLFAVDVVSVRVIRTPSKLRRVGTSYGMTSPTKKAVVTLKADQKIDAFEAS